VKYLLIGVERYLFTACKKSLVTACTSLKGRFNTLKRKRTLLERPYVYLISHPDTSSVEDGLLRVVCEAVGDHQVKILLEIVHGLVPEVLDFVPHGGQVHGFLHHVHVIGNFLKVHRLRENLAVILGLQIFENSQ